MGRQIREDLIGKIHTEKITNIPSFDDVICHTEAERKYFTVENNDIIYNRLMTEAGISRYDLPYLGPCVDFGMGDICLEETKDIFKFYIVDRASKLQYKEYDKIEDAIQKLASYYEECEMVDNSRTMEDIFYQTLGLNKEDSIKIR